MTSLHVSKHRVQQYSWLAMKCEQFKKNCPHVKNNCLFSYNTQFLQQCSIACGWLTPWICGTPLQKRSFQLQFIASWVLSTNINSSTFGTGSYFWFLPTQETQTTSTYYNIVKNYSSWTKEASSFTCQDLSRCQFL